MVRYETNLNQIKLSDRTKRICKYAEMEAQKSIHIVYPIHLLLGILRERTGVCAEIYLQYPSLYEILEKRVQKADFQNAEQNIRNEFLDMNISLSTLQVLENARKRMMRYKQVYINEGVLIKAIFDVNDEITKAVLKGIEISPIVEILSSPWDMIVSLRDYSLPEFIFYDELIIRKATIEDANALIAFVEEEFGKGWLESVHNGLQEGNIPIYIGIQNGEIIGFACFDVVRRKKGLFGPMGTAMAKRTQRIGYMLLHCCLNEMKEIGYEYAVIGEAGPLEFYEKACKAVIIPR